VLLAAQGWQNKDIAAEVELDSGALLHTSLDGLAAPRRSALVEQQFDPWGDAHGCNLYRGRSVPHRLSSTISSALH